MEIKKYLINSSVEWTSRDYALFFGLIPLALILFFVLPADLQNQIILKPLEPTLLSAFFSNYLHTNLEHLVGNLFSYLTVMLLLFNLETDKKRFYFTALVMLTILPPISSTFIILVLSRIISTSVGFSAIVAGLLGYMVYALYAYVKRNYYSQLTYNFLWLLLMLNVFVWSISWLNYDFLLISSIMIIWLFYMNRQAIKETLLKIRPKIRKPLKKLLPQVGFILLTVALAVLGLQTLLTRDFASQGHLMINIPAHYVGYLCGLIFPLIYDNFVRSKNDNKGT